jgi:cell wall-associated NlpC family hydrolase
MLNLEGLEHREFIDGKQDCFALLRDLYSLNFNIKLRDYARPSDWEADVLDLITRAYKLEGFEQLTHWKLGDLRPGDVMAMCVGASKPNHLGIYIGNNEFVHHLRGNLSSRSPLKGHWLHYTAFLLRHPEVPDLRSELRDITIEELLRDRYKVETESSS